MDIPGKLKHDLWRIYGQVNPLDCLEDAMVVGSDEGPMIQLFLRVPPRCCKYVDYSPIRRASYDVYAMGNWGPKPDKKVDDSFPKPERVIYSGPKTIVKWSDGTKTTVSRMAGEDHDEYGAFCAAVVKKMFGATHKAKKFLDTIKVNQKSRFDKLFQQDAEEA